MRAPSIEAPELSSKNAVSSKTKGCQKANCALRLNSNPRHRVVWAPSRPSLLKRSQFSTRNPHTLWLTIQKHANKATRPSPSASSHSPFWAFRALAYFATRPSDVPETGPIITNTREKETVVVQATAAPPTNTTIVVQATPVPAPDTVVVAPPVNSTTTTTTTTQGTAPRNAQPSSNAPVASPPADEPNTTVKQHHHQPARALVGPVRPNRSNPTPPRRAAAPPLTPPLRRIATRSSVSKDLVAQQKSPAPRQARGFFRQGERGIPNPRNFRSTVFKTVAIDHSAISPSNLFYQITPKFSSC